MKKKKRKSLRMLLLSLILLISIGFALLSTNLIINGNGKIDNVTWDVHFENVQISDSSTVTPNVVPSAPAADKLQRINYDVAFDIPGQTFEFLVDIVNSGSIDAIIDSFTSKMKIDNGEELVISSDNENLPSYLSYNVTYSDDSAIVNNHLLSANSKETVKVSIKFKDDITNDELLSAVGKVISLNFEFSYKQATDEIKQAYLREPGTYVVTSETINTGLAIPSVINPRSTPVEAMNIWKFLVGDDKARPIYMKYVLDENKIVKESYLGFIVTRSMARTYDGMVEGAYYLKGDSTVKSFNNNMEIVKKAFGYSTHPDRCSGSINSFFECHQSGFSAIVHPNGTIYLFNGDGTRCLIHYNASSCSRG